MNMREALLFLLMAAHFSLCSLNTQAQGKNRITIQHSNFYLNGAPFEFTGISFFNAIYNPEFNKSSEERQQWLKKFNENGINVLRVWCQWDNARGFADASGEATMYLPDGSLNAKHLNTLVEILKDADKQGTVVLLVFFSQESWKENIRLSDKASETAVAGLTKSLMPYRNLIFQVWNEHSYRTVDYYKIVKQIDPERIVTSSTGYAGDLGSQDENRTLDYLSPHTTRDDDRHWEVAEKEVGYLIEKFNKPVVDDEPARRGTPNFGGPKNPTSPMDHIIHIYNVWKAGGYVIYHHDMFQTGYGTEAVPLNGIPAPGFSSYHDQVFNFLKNKHRYLKSFRN